MTIAGPVLRPVILEWQMIDCLLADLNEQQQAEIHSHAIRLHNDPKKLPNSVNSCLVWGTIHLVCMQKSVQIGSLHSLYASVLFSPLQLRMYASRTPES